MLENEEFQRLPLPPNYDLNKEMLDNLKMYPDLEEMQRNIRVFRNERVPEKKNILAQFAYADPFGRIKFLCDMDK